jgi:sec-independent protein translocase protein TatC
MATKLTLPRPRLLRLPRRGSSEPRPPTPEDQGEGAVMGFFEHLEELRQHLYRAVLGLAGGMVIALLFANNVMAYIAASAATYKIGLQAIAPTESVAVFFRVVLLIAGIVASPWITYQLLSFVTPGLTRQEKRALWKSIPFTTVLFVFGVIFTWAVLMPAYIGWLAGFQADVIKPIWTADNYFGFVTQVLFWHGVIFETPVLFYVLARIGIVTANQLLKYWRHALVGAAAVSGFLAPTYDPLTMIIITILIFGLYMASVGMIIIAIPSSFTRTPKTKKA